MRKRNEQQTREVVHTFRRKVRRVRGEVYALILLAESLEPDPILDGLRTHQENLRQAFDALHGIVSY